MTTKKDYLGSEVIERAFILKLFYDKPLREKFLKQTLPAVFVCKKKRVIFYIMQKLNEDNINITLDNVVLKFREMSESLIIFMKKHKVIYFDKSSVMHWVEMITENDIYNILTDESVDAPADLIEMAVKQLNRMAFSRFVSDRYEDIKYYNEHSETENANKVISAARAIITVHDLLYKKSLEKRDQLEEMKDLVNSDSEYISTSSTALNSYLGGFTRGYVSSIIAKSSHGKSSWVDYNAVHTLLAGKVKRIDIISPEESASTRWRRITAMLNLVSLSSMRQKDVKVLNAHIEKVREKLYNKLFIWDNVFKYNDIIELMSKLTTDMIIVDHLQAIEYPGVGDFLARMIGNIPGFVDFEKKLAKKKHNCIVNLSQVNDKDIQRSDRLSKAPRYWDAYGSSVLYQAAREYIALWYPYKDYEDNPISFTGNTPTIHDIQMSIEKSSFSKIGKIHLHFEPEFNIFTDKVITSKRMDYTAPVEKDISQLSLI